MRIAFAVEADEGLDSPISPHFGRCPYYAFVDVEDGEPKAFQVLPNPFYYDHGAPGQVPNFIAKQGASAIIAGGMGPRPALFFQHLGIEAVSGVGGTVKETLRACLHGDLHGTEPCAGGHGDHGPCDEKQSEEDVLAEEVRRLRQKAGRLQQRLRATEQLTRGESRRPDQPQP